MTCAVENWSVSDPSNYLTKRSFERVQIEYFSFLRCDPGGTGYCDTCYTCRTSVRNAEDSVKLHIEDTLARHRHNAELEFSFYKSLSTICRQTLSREDLHEAFDFGEKALLPSFRKKPGTLHFSMD